MNEQTLQHDDVLKTRAALGSEIGKWDMNYMIHVGTNN